MENGAKMNRISSDVGDPDKFDPVIKARRHLSITEEITHVTFLSDKLM